MANLVAPVIPESYNPMDSFLKGFSVVAQINQRRQQSELTMQRMALEMQLREQAFEQKKVQQVGAAERASERMDISQRRLELETQKQEFAEDKFRTEIDDIQGLMGELQQLKAKPGTPERNAKLAEIAAKHPYASRNSLGKSVITKEWEDHEGAVKSKAKLFNDKLKQFGLPYNAFENSQEWIERPDGKQYYYRTDPATGQKEQVPITVNNSTFKTLNKEFQDILGATVQAPSRQMEESDDKHKLEWRKAKAAMMKKGATAVKSVYQSKGYDPDELDLDQEPP